jgi:uncharacterized protein DUF1016
MIDTPIYTTLFNNIVSIYISGKTKALQTANTVLIETYWKIGQHIVQFEQGGNIRAEYGDKLLERLARDLALSYGRGFSLSNIKRFRQFYITYPIGATPSHQFNPENQSDVIGAEPPHLLTWTHYVELLKIGDPLERSFYEKQSMVENWSTTELIRQKKSSLFLRLAAGKDKNAILKLAKQGQIIEKPEDILKDTYVFEFLKIPKPYHISETDLETRLINQLQGFY